MTPPLTALTAYRDRSAAGKALEPHLRDFAGREDALVVALARGGVPVGSELARALGLPLGALWVRKLTLPLQPDVPYAAVAADGECVFNHDVVRTWDLDDREIDSSVTAALRELAERERPYAESCPTPPVEGRSILLVDDGAASGISLRAAISSLQRQQAARVVVALPVASIDACRALASEIDAVICPLQPQPFYAVGLAYEHFPKLTDDEALALLKASHPETETRG